MENKILKMGIIPSTSPVYMQLNLLAEECRIAIFSGLPGTGKSLFINEFYDLAKSKGRKVTVVQWDKARKAFELSDILRRFPMGEGTVHDGIKLLAGEFIKREVRSWHQNAGPADLLLIEAPLAGHRFIELAERSDDDILEEALSHESCKFIIPVPSRDIRARIEEERKRQVEEGAKEWFGAKPSVMQMLWEDLYRIAIDFDMDVPDIENPPYDPEVIEFLFSKILRHRHMVILPVEELFEVPAQSEDELHSLDSLVADEKTALTLFEYITERFESDEAISNYVSGWYWQ